jgi:UrcA family protein
MSTARARFHRRVGAAVAAVLALSVSAFGIGSGIRTEVTARPLSVKVAYSGLDLSRPEAAQLLYRRLQQASAAVCGPLDRLDVAAYVGWRRCYDGALQRAVLQVNAPQLLAVYRRDASDLSSHG